MHIVSQSAQFAKTMGNPEVVVKTLVIRQTCLFVYRLAYLHLYMYDTLQYCHAFTTVNCYALQYFSFTTFAYCLN